MPEEGPLGRAKERVGFHVGRASAGTDAAQFIFDEEFADKRLTKAENAKSAFDITTS